MKRSLWMSPIVDWEGKEWKAGTYILEIENRVTTIMTDEPRLRMIADAEHKALAGSKWALSTRYPNSWGAGWRWRMSKGGVTHTDKKHSVKEQCNCHILSILPSI